MGGGLGLGLGGGGTGNKGLGSSEPFSVLATVDIVYSNSLIGQPTHFYCPDICLQSLLQCKYT